MENRDELLDLIYKLHKKVNRLQVWLIWMSLMGAAAFASIIF